MNQIAGWLESHMMPCFYKQISGIDCPGCGMQRSFVFLLRGDLLASIRAYPALLPIFFTLTFTFLHLFFNFKNGAVIIKYSFIISSIIILTNYILKFI